MCAEYQQCPGDLIKLHVYLGSSSLLENITLPLVVTELWTPALTLA